MFDIYQSIPISQIVNTHSEILRAQRIDGKKEEPMARCGRERGFLEGTSAEEGKGQESSVLLGCQGGGDIVQDIGEAIERPESAPYLYQTNNRH